MLDQRKAGAADGDIGAQALALLLASVQRHTASADALDRIFVSALVRLKSIVPVQRYYRIAL